MIVAIFPSYVVLSGDIFKTVLQTVQEHLLWVRKWEGLFADKNLIQTFFQPCVIRRRCSILIMGVKVLMQIIYIR